MAGLDKIQVKGFKSIRDAEIELRSLNVLIGANGAGKSNFIALFRMLNEMLEGRLQTYTSQVSAESLLYFGSKTTSSIGIDLTFGNNGYHAVFLPSDQGTLIFGEEAVSFHDRAHYGYPYRQSLGKGHPETQLRTMRTNTRPLTVAGYVIKSLESWKVYHFHDTSRSAGIKQMGQIEDNLRLRADASNLAAFLYMLRETQRPYYDRIVKTIRLVAPFFVDFALRPSGLNPDIIRLEWTESGSDTYLNAHMLSDGTLRFMCLATLLLQPDLPSVILIDEPELGLHPYAITLLASLLRGAATQTQVIVSTQSVPLINQFVPDDIVVVEREDNQTVFRRLDPQNLAEWVEDYGLGDLWEKNLIGGRPA